MNSDQWAELSCHTEHVSTYQLVGVLESELSFKWRCWSDRDWSTTRMGWRRCQLKDKINRHDNRLTTDMLPWQIKLQLTQIEIFKKRSAMGRSTMNSLKTPARRRVKSRVKVINQDISVANGYVLSISNLQFSTGNFQSGGTFAE